MDQVRRTFRQPFSSESPYTVAKELVQREMVTPNRRSGVLHHNEMFYVWMGGRWTEQTRKEVENQVMRCLEGTFYVKRPESEGEPPVLAKIRNSPSYAADVVRSMEAVCAARYKEVPHLLVGEGGPAPERSVAFQDVVVEVGEEGFRTWPRTEEWFDPVVLPVDWDEGATSPTLERCLEEWSDGDEAWKELWLRWTGAALTPDRRWARWLFKYGKVRGGKGMHDAVLRMLMGRGFAGTSLEVLSGPFGLSGLQNARVVSVSEVNELDGAAGARVSSWVKQVVGRDEIRVNEKNQPIGRGVVFAGCVQMSGNEVPTLPDKGLGLSSKMLLLPYTVSFLGREALGLEEKLRAELQGVAAMVMRARVRLEKEKVWPVPAAAAQKMREYRAATNVYQAFLEARFVERAGGYVHNRVVLGEWRDWLRRTGVAAPCAENMLFVKLCSEATWHINRGRRLGEQRGVFGMVARTTPEDTV